MFDQVWYHCLQFWNLIICPSWFLYKSDLSISTAEKIKKLLKLKTFKTRKTTISSTFFLIKRLQGYRCESCNVIFAWMVIWNYPYSPFKKKPSEDFHFLSVRKNIRHQIIIPYPRCNICVFSDSGEQFQWYQPKQECNSEHRYHNNYLNNYRIHLNLEDRI